MDDGSQKLLDVIDDPTALESFLGLSAAAAAAAAAAATAAAAGEIVSITTSSRAATATTTTTTLESLVDSLQQGLLDPTGASRGAPSGGINPSTGSLVLTQQQLQQLQHLQQQQQQHQHHHHHHHHQVGQGRGVASSHQQNSGQAAAVTFTLPPHSNPASNVGSSASGAVVTSSSSPCVTTHHFVLTPFQQTTSQPPTSFIYTPASSASAPICTTATGLPSIAINHTGGAILTATPNTSQPSVSMAPSASNLFIPTGAPAAQGSNPGGVLVGPSGTAVFASASAAAVASPDSPFSVPTRSPAPHAPPTPSPSPLPLRSPASVPSHHPPSPAPSPYHTQLQSPQQSSSSSNYTAQHYVTASSQPAGPGSSFVLSSSQSNTNYKDAFSIQQQQQPLQQPSVVVMPTQQQQRPQQSQTQSSSSSNPSPVQSPYSQHLMQHLNNGTGGSQPTRSPQQQTPGGALTPAPSPSPQTRTAASPVIRSTTPQPPTVIHQTITAGLALSGTGQFPVMPPGSTAMLQGNHQLVQIIHHQAAVPQTNTFPAHTQIITTAGHGGGMPLQQPGSTKPKQPPQILPKPPSGQPATPGHTKIPSSARTSVSTQHQNLHTQHQATTPAAQVVIGQANPTAVIPTAQSGTLLLNQVLRLITAQGPMQLQQIQTPAGPTLIAVPSGQTLSFQQLGPTPPSLPPPPQAAAPAPPPAPPAAPASATQPQQRPPTPHQPSQPIIPAMQLSTATRPQTLNINVPNPSIGAHTISVGTSNSATSVHTPIIQHNNHQVHSQTSQQQNQSTQQQHQMTNAGLPPRQQPAVHDGVTNTQCFPMVQRNSVSGTVLQHHCMTATDPNLNQQKKKPKKKKKKKKKEEETKLDLANIMKLSGIGDDEDMSMYDTDEATLPVPPSQTQSQQSPQSQQSSQQHTPQPIPPPSSQSPAPGQLEVGTQSSPTTSQPPSTQQQSQLIAQLRSPPQHIPIQGASGAAGSASLRLALEDGRVIFHPSDAQAANIILQNIATATTSTSSASVQASPSVLASSQHQHSLTTAQNQLSALLTAGGNAAASSGSNNHVVLSHLLQQSTQSGLPPHLISTGTNTPNTRTASSLPPSPSPTPHVSVGTNMPPQSDTRFGTLQGKTGYGPSDGTKLDSGIMGLQATKNCNHGFKVESSTNTAMHNKTSPIPPAGVMVDGHGGAHLLVQQAKSPVQHTCGHHLIGETKEIKHNSATTQTTQTEILHHTQGTLHLGQNSNKPSEQFLASKPVNTEATGSAFLGLHSFQNLQGLVSTAGASIPLMTASVATSTCGSGLGASGEQLLIAHHGGMSVLATPQLIQQLTQGAQAAGIVNMPQLQLASNALNKMQGLAFNPQTGTIVIGGNEAIAFNNQHKPTAVALNSTTVTAAAAAKVVPSSTQQPSVVVQQVNASANVGSPSAPAVRRCSSDSNSSISIGSPTSGSSGTTVIGLINPNSTLPARKQQTQQSIETQTISLGIPPTSSATQNVQNSILESIAHAHPNLVLNKLVATPQQAPHLLANANTIIGPKKKKPPKQTRNMTNKILPIVTTPNLPTSINRHCSSSVSVGTDCSKVEQQRNLMKVNTVCQGTQHVLRHTTPNYMPASSFPQQQQQQHVSAMPPLTSICSVTQSATSTMCQAGSNTAPTIVTSALPTSVVSKVVSGSCTSETAMQHVTVTTRTVAVGHHCAASQTQPPQQMQQGGVTVPHLVPIPPAGGSSASPGGPTVYQKVQTIQLTPQNQKHLKAVQMQIQSLTAKKNPTSIDQATLQRLYEEQQRILLTGKVVPTIPGQHALGLPIPNSDVLEGKQKTSMEVPNNATSTYLANLLRQQSTISSQHQNCPVAQESVGQVSVRYQHQVGNQVIPLAPPQQQQKQVLVTPTVASVVSSSSVVTTTIAAPITTRASISVQCGSTSPDSNKLMSAACIKQVPPSCEKGTSPLQVQVGTQTGLPCLDSPHAKLSPITVTSKLSPGQQQQVYCSPSKVQPMFAAASVAAKVPPMPGNMGIVKNSSASTGSQTTPQSLLPSGCKVAVVAPVSPTDRTTPIVTLAAAVPSHQPPATPLCATSVATNAAVSSSLPKHPSITSPVRPTISRGDLIEQQLKTDQNGACMPDTQTPFQSTSDACKRLIRYHVFNEQVLSQQDLEKADEIFEATARHLLDKFRQMMNKYRYLLLMESMREVNTSELMMIDRMFVAEEHTLLEKLREEERQVKEEPLASTESVPSSVSPPLQTVEVKMEPVESPAERLKEVRIMVQDVMKDHNFKRELEEDMKVTVARPASGEYDEWEEIQKELAVYSPSAATVKSEPHSEPDTGDPPESSSPPGVHSQSGPCGPRDEGGGCVSSGIASGEKRKDICDSSAVIHRKKRHKTGSGSPLSEEDDINAQVQCAIDSILNLQRSEDGFDLHSTQAGNGQSAVKPSTEMGVPMDEGPDGEDTRVFVDESRSIVKQCSGAVDQIVRTRHKRNSASSKTSDHSLVMNSFHHNYSSGSGERTIEGSGGDSALDEAVRSILTS